MQYKAAQAITDAIKGTFREKLDQELSIESLRKRRYIEDSATFSKHLKINLWSIYSEYFLALAKHIIQELMIRFLSSVLNIIFSQILFFINYH